jgi:hypothetical protein
VTEEREYAEKMQKLQRIVGCREMLQVCENVGSVRDGVENFGRVAGQEPRSGQLPFFMADAQRLEQSVRGTKAGTVEEN